MKKILLLALYLVPSILFAQNNIVIEGKIGTLPAPAKIFLVWNKDHIDSTVLDNGHFKFEGHVNEFNSVVLILSHENETLSAVAARLKRKVDKLIFFIEPGKIVLESKDSIKNANITGSTANADYKTYTSLLAKNMEAEKLLNKESVNATPAEKGDTIFKKDLLKRFDEVHNAKKNIQEKFIKDHDSSYISMIALVGIGGNTSTEELKALFESLSPKMRNTIMGKTIDKALNDQEKLNIGAVAPEFTINDVNNHPFTLSSLRGKYVLIDFWASWCMPCRAENPNVVNAYKKYKDKRFTVVGVSLDRPGKKDDWLKAIKTDGLEWTQVSDLKFWDSAVAKQYKIRAIPQNYLIDPRGKIIGKNLRGEELNKKLESLLN